MSVVILGAGLTGLSTAYHLEQQGFYDYKIFEKDAISGGLCRSIEQDGFTFDFTGHLLHSNDAYFSTFLNTVCGPDAFNAIQRRSFIYSHDTYTHFPFQSNLYGLPADVIVECIEGFIKKPTKLAKNASFHDWAVHMFGDGITKHFFDPYQTKIFAYDINKITASWTGRFVPNTSLTDLIKAAIAPQVSSSAGYNPQFLYPKKGGIFSLIQGITKQITNPIKTKYSVESIDLKNKIITFANGDFERFETLINTIPLDIFLEKLKEPSSVSLRKQSSKLLCNSIANFNLGVQNPNISDKHWVYLPEEKFPQYRMGFYHNFSTHMTPPGCSSVYGEFAYLKSTDPIRIQEAISQGIASTQKLLEISPAQIITERTIHISHAYVLFDFWREKNLPKIHEILLQNNIHSIGRYGAWKYSSMQESVLDGKTMAELIVSQNTGTLPYLTPPLSKIDRIQS